jgi:hypothetical protein
MATAVMAAMREAEGPDTNDPMFLADDLYQALDELVVQFKSDKTIVPSPGASADQVEASLVVIVKMALVCYRPATEKGAAPGPQPTIAGDPGVAALVTDARNRLPAELLQKLYDIAEIWYDVVISCWHEEVDISPYFKQ